MNSRETVPTHSQNVSINHWSAVKLFRTALAAASLLTFLPTPLSAHSYKLGDLTVGHIWSPVPSEGGRSIPVYAGVLNKSDRPITLVGAETTAAASVRIRKAKNGSVQWPDGIVYKPGSPFALAPWREHLWIKGLNQPLREGDSVKLTLDFGETGTLDVVVVIEPEGGH